MTAPRKNTGNDPLTITDPNDIWPGLPGLLQQFGQGMIDGMTRAAQHANTGAGTTTSGTTSKAPAKTKPQAPGKPGKGPDLKKARSPSKSSSSDGSDDDSEKEPAWLATYDKYTSSSPVNPY